MGSERSIDRLIQFVLGGVIWAGVCLFFISPVVGQDFQRQLQRTDSLRDAGALAEAMAELQRLRTVHPLTSEVLWRVAYVRIEMGERIQSMTLQENFFRTALQEAQLAITADSTNSYAYTIRAMAAGRTASVTTSTNEQMELSRLVKESADRAIALDPTNDVAYHVRGRWHHEIANLSFFTRAMARLIYGGFADASFQQAVDDLKKAIQLRDRIPHRFFLADTYRVTGRTKEAITQWQCIMSMPVESIEDRDFKDQTRELLRKFGGRRGRD